MNKQDAERFWSKVDKTSGCWLWTASKTPRGYGSFYLNPKLIPAHRVVYELAYGPIPKGMLVCHHCDNPSCVRPDHLFLGTDNDNKADCVTKNRHTWPSNIGVDNPRTKLNEDMVRGIRGLYAQGLTQTEIARIYPVKQRAISDVVLGRSWSHVK